MSAMSTVVLHSLLGAHMRTTGLSAVSSGGPRLLELILRWRRREGLRYKDPCSWAITCRTGKVPERKQSNPILCKYSTPFPHARLSFSCCKSRDCWRGFVAGKKCNWPRFYHDCLCEANFLNRWKAAQEIMWFPRHAASAFAPISQYTV